MGKGRSLHPADAQRRLERKKELNKNKANRAKTRELATVKKDTRDSEAEILKLEEEASTNKLDKNGKARLESLRQEVDRVKKAKADYVEAHPEHAKLVYPGGRPPREKREAGPSAPRPVAASRNLFGPDGLPLHPERSIYYDAVLNPFGVPPPGMPYVERPHPPDEIPSEEQPIVAPDFSDDESEDDDVPLPAGPPPPIDSYDSEDDIPMPEGPPPAPPLPPGVPPANVHISSIQTLPVPPPPPGAPPMQVMSFLPTPGGTTPLPGVPPPQAYVPPPLPPPPPPPVGSSQAHAPPPPPPGFPPFPPQQAQFFVPPPPPGGPPGRQGPRQPRILQDPLSSTPHSTYQGHRAMRQNMAIAPPPGLTPIVPANRPRTQAAAVISAEPELRDLKREATAFVPTAVKRRKTTATQQIKTRMNAAPDPSHDEGDPFQGPQRPDLVATLRSAGIGAKVPENSLLAKTKIKDDYDDFLGEVGDILE